MFISRAARRSLCVCLLLFAASAGLRAQEVVLPFDGSAAPGETFVKNGAEQPVFVAGRDGQAIQFGDGAVVALPLDLDARRHPQVTVTLWVKAGADAAAQGWLFGPGDGNNQPFIKIVGGRHVAVEGRYADGTPGVLESDTALPVDEWVPVAAVWDYDSKSIQLKVGSETKLFAGLEMDVEAGDVLPQRLWTAPNAPAGAERQPYVFIGARNFRAAFPARGFAIDDVKIFTGALGETEVAASGNSTADSSPTAQASGSGEAGSACAANSDCSDGLYCAIDRTCHPDEHAPLTSLTQTTGATATSGTENMATGTTFGSTAVPDSTLSGLGDNRVAVPEKTGIAVSWQLAAGTTGTRVSCTDAGTDRVSIVTTPTTSASGTDHVFECTQGTASVALSPGSYTAVISLLQSGSGNSIADVTRSGITVSDTGQLSDLGVVTFTVVEATLAATAEPSEQTSNDTSSTISQIGEETSAMRYDTSVLAFSGISGSKGTFSERVVFTETQGLLNRLQTDEKDNYPCLVIVGSDRSTDGKIFDACGNMLAITPGLFRQSGYELDLEAPAGTAITALQVCKPPLNKKVKGFRVRTRRLDSTDGVLSSSYSTVTDDLANCAVWQEWVSCASKSAAVGVILYFKDAAPDFLSGVELVCAELTP
ncbi:MAG: hypothetical protein P8173_15825 [Gammaproteobacteria bacterium]|jgi:hypothetical protein